MSENLRKSSTDIVTEATVRQRAASDPFISSWVGASAGSGKTKVLTDRMLRLLLPREDGRPGTPPEKILALTFTKAGANEMAQRLSKQLSAWAVMDTEKLSDAMEKDLFGRAPTSSELDAARKLFARVVDTPGGMKIMTIHSFCQSILGRFPIEAGLNPNFKPLEEDHAREILLQAKKSILIEAARYPASPLGKAIAGISAAMNEEQFGIILSAIVGERNQFRTILKKTFGVEGLYTNLCAQFEIPTGLTEEDALEDFCAMENADIDGLRAACDALSLSTKSTDNKKSAAMEGFLAAPPEKRAGLYDDYRGGFIAPSTGQPYANAATKEVLDKNPAIETILQTEAARIIAFEDTRKKIACAAISRDLFRVADAVLEQYAAEKSAQGALDFDDLILKTLDLLRGDVPKFKGLDATPWIMYKLDEGLDHILVDEAQDTNPEQWDIIRLLAEEFFTGEGARDILRTLFVVGDEKQSIFSFQRAAPERFEEMHRYFEKKIRDAGHIFRHIDINTSFRSVESVLDAVDTVFSGGPDLGTRYLNHIPKRAGQAGIVEVWPVFRGSQQTDEEENTTGTGAGWGVPDRIVESQSGAAQMAAHIAKTIAGWIESGEKLESYDRPVRAGDILILVRSRNAFVAQLVRALKKAKVAVSGVDRMILEEQLVVQDLCAASAFALLPEDDLTLACLLKSPFIGMEEKTLYDLSYKRSGSLWESVKKNGDRKVVSWLEQLIARAGADRPYEFYSRILQESCPADAHGGMRSIRLRLGDDALDPVDEFLNIALGYEVSHTSGLQGFLKWLEEDNRQIKRELDEGGGAVRIMTVHGAKGLQAPIVFLPDTIRTNASAKSDSLFWPHRTGLDLPFYVSSKAASPALADRARLLLEQKAEEEYRRLLYVAMTRAEERLYIGGYVGKRGPSATGKIAYWYDDIRASMAAHPDIEEIESGVTDKDGVDMPILRLARKASAKPDNTAKNKAESENTDIVPPGWASLPAPVEPTPPRPLAPSRPSESEPAAASPLAASQEYRFKRGTVTHKLLQFLPSLPADARRAAAQKFLARSALALPPALQKDIADEVAAILEHPVFGDIFGPRSMAEIPLTGMLDGNLLVSGQIDRLLVTETDILIIDYKTNRPPPQRLEDVAPVYLRQMGTYARLLKTIYPGRTVRAALLWTDGARLMEIPV